jgi:hypothetical protein
MICGVKYGQESFSGDRRPKFYSELKIKKSEIKTMKSNRRNFIRTMGAGATGIALGTTAVTATACSSAGSKKEDEDGQVLFIGDNIALPKPDMAR